MLFDSTSDQLIKNMNIDRVIKEDENRRKRMAERWQLMSGNYKELVRREVMKGFKQTYGKLDAHIDVSTNIFKRVIDEVYRHPGAKREFLRGTDVDPAWDLLDKAMDLDLIMSEVTQAVGAYNDCLIQVLPGLEESDSPEVRVFLPHECTVISYPQKASEPMVVMYENADGDTVVWTPEEHYVMVKGKFAKPAPGASDMTNPFGFLPFIAVHSGARNDSFWDADSKESLKDVTLQISAGWTAMNYQRHMQAFSQPVIVNAPQDFKPPSMLDPGSFLTIYAANDGSPGASVQAIPMSPDVRQHVETIMNNIGLAVSEWGLGKESFLRSMQASSGFSRLIERQSLLERRAQVMPYIIKAEHELAEMIRLIWNMTNSPEISDASEFNVSIMDEPVYMTPIEEEQIKAQKLANWQTEVTMGIKSKAELIAEVRGISLDEAKEIVAQIQTEQAPAQPANPFARLLGGGN